MNLREIIQTIRDLHNEALEQGVEFVDVRNAAGGVKVTTAEGVQYLITAKRVGRLSKEQTVALAELNGTWTPFSAD